MFCILCMFCIENFLRLILQNITQPVRKKKNASINDSTLSKRRMALSCSKKTVCIIKKKNIMRNYFLSLFFSNRKPEVS